MKDFNKSYGKALDAPQTHPVRASNTPQTQLRQALELHLDMLPLVQNMIGDSV